LQHQVEEGRLMVTRRAALSRRDLARLLVLGAAARSLHAWAADLPTEPAPATGDEMLEAAIAGTATPGIAALVIRDFTAEAERVAGVRALSGAAVEPGDRWHLGSNGKAITATLIARLVETGKLRWETPLAELLPMLAADMQASYREATLPDLLSHRAGLPENTSDFDFFWSFYEDAASPTAQRLRYLGTALREAPVGPARGEPSYSNTGYLLAAAAAEHATGDDFESLIGEQLFESLGMTSVSFDQFGGIDEPRGHVDGRIADRPRDVNPRMFVPAGGMRMTLQDWSRFCIDQLQGERGEGRLLRPETYRFLHAGQGGTKSALGWGAAPQPMGLRGPALTHAGSDGNWMAYVCLFTETGNGVLVAANAADSMGGDKAALAALRALARTVAEPAS
jgi:CubicO group peptidase (beta-lactamase class C family)